VTLFYNELQMSTYVADKRLQWARGLTNSGLIPGQNDEPVTRT